MNTNQGDIEVSDDLQSDLLVDCWNLANECHALVKSLEPFAFPNGGILLMEEYSFFIRGKNVNIYLDAVRQLANKVHGLKGVLGFMVREGKSICHQSEDIIKPLADLRLILDDKLYSLLLEFIYVVQEMLEAYEKGAPFSVPLEDWERRFQTAFQRAANFNAGKQEEFQTLLRNRSADDGAIRKRERTEFIKVSREGYEELISKINTLYQLVVTQGSSELGMKANIFYNTILDQHQSIKKIPMDFSRYDRLVPTLAEKYMLRARFFHTDSGVRAENDFWNSIHEIANHIIKNSVIHGIEPPLERIRFKKEENGRIHVEISDDALHVFLSISDDGRGMDGDKLAAKAVHNGLITREQALAMSPAEKLNLVFEQGVTTIEQADDNAGRGIGMNAVKEVMEQLNGKCAIASTRGGGTEWHFTFPKLHVSLSSLVISFSGYRLVIPEEHVLLFSPRKEALLSSVREKPVFRFQEHLIPVLESASLFGEAMDPENMEPGTRTPQRVMVVESHGERIALLINDVLDKLVLPVTPLPPIMRNNPIFIGATLYQEQPVMVLNVHNLADYL